MDYKMGTAEIVIEFCHRINYGIRFKFLDHPPRFSKSERFRDEMNRSELGLDNLEEYGSYAKVGSVGVEVNGIGVVEVEILNGGTDC